MHSFPKNNLVKFPIQQSCSYCLCFIYVSSKITNYWKNLFLKNIREIEDSLFYFLYYPSQCLWSVIPISEIKSKEVFDNILGKMYFK